MKFCLTEGDTQDTFIQPVILLASYSEFAELRNPFPKHTDQDIDKFYFQYAEMMSGTSRALAHTHTHCIHLNLPNTLLLSRGDKAILGSPQVSGYIRFGLSEGQLKF